MEEFRKSGRVGRRPAVTDIDIDTLETDEVIKRVKSLRVKDRFQDKKSLHIEDKTCNQEVSNNNCPATECVTKVKKAKDLNT